MRENQTRATDSSGRLLLPLNHIHSSLNQTKNWSNENQSLHAKENQFLEAIEPNVSIKISSFS
jgi:hypothetical protein